MAKKKKNQATPLAPEPGEDSLAAARRKFAEQYRRNRGLIKRVARFVQRRAFWVPVGVLTLTIWALNSPFILNAFLLIGGYVGQLLFAILFMVVQFGALFWFIGRTRSVIIKPGDPKQVTFAEYWGQPELIKLVKQWISLLGDRDKFVGMGGEFINGLLLFGAPGTGKTLLAKAMAGEAGVAFMSVEGSGFRGMFMGMDTMKMMGFVRKARKLAREHGACIAYIDELDAVGQSRSGVMGDGNAGGMMGGGGGMMGGMGMNGALTRLLYEMDGIGDPTPGEKFKAKLYKRFGKEYPKRDWHVLFMGSTNRPDVLDPALLRPGRFDAKIKVERPDRVGRKEIIKGYLSKIKHDPDQVDVDAIVADTPRATPAQVMSAITKDAVRRAIFSGRDAVIQDDIDQAIQEQLVGMANPIREMDPIQLRQIAYHEAGHAVIQHYVMPDQRISRLSITRRSSGALGYMMPVDTVEIYGQPLRRIVADIMVSLAGHIAVKVFMGEFWTGAYSDYNNVRRNFRELAVLGYFGPPVSELHRDVKELRFKDERVERMWLNLEQQVEQLLFKKADEIEAIVEALHEKKELTNTEVMALLGKNYIQTAQDQGESLESVLEHIGTSAEGLAYKNKKPQKTATIKKSTPKPKQNKGTSTSNKTDD
ncbi:MAG: AAA family ATPase [Anaerolineae bacterium]|nr:AAA family ATPase [Anaerolineae bacterium]